MTIFIDHVHIPHQSECHPIQFDFLAVQSPQRSRLQLDRNHLRRRTRLRHLLRTLTLALRTLAQSSPITAFPQLTHPSKHHDEIMEVVSGTLTFWVDHEEIVATPSTGPIVIPRGTVHGMTSHKGVAVSLRETTAPAGGFKALFFQDLFQEGEPSFGLVLRCFADHDTWVEVPGGYRWIDWLVSYIDSSLHCCARRRTRRAHTET
jgi:mannose-6-phosphate isomerase-like protein (cupin superfamily)